MNVTVTFRNLPSSDPLRDHAEQKSAKFSKYLREPVDLHFVLRVEKIRQIAEVNLSAKNFHAHALEESPDMYTSLDRVISKLESQLRKHKDRVKNHKVENKAYDALGGAATMLE